MPAARRLLVTGLALAVMAALGYLLLWPSSPEDELPLADVPNDELERPGIVVEPASERDAPVSSAAARSLADDIACCGDIQQTVLVRLGRRGDSSPQILAWAVNFDTSSGPDTLPIGGHWRTGFTRDEAFFVLFLDATTGRHIYSLFPGTEYPFPEKGGDVSLNGITQAALEGVGIQIETPQPGDRAAFAPTLRNLYDSAAADRGVTSEFVLARVVEAPYPDWSLMWVASVNVGGRPHVNSSGQMIGITDQYTLVFFEPDSGNAVFQKDIFIPGS